MFQGDAIYKLSTLSISPQEINLSPNDFTFDPRLPTYKLEIWLGNILLDETYDITFSEKQINKTSQILIFANKTFRYFARQLFNRAKVARLRIVIIRGTSQWEQTEQIQAFNIVLSQYSYEYCKNKRNQFRQHAVGTVKRAFFHYRIICEYEEYVTQKQHQQSISEKTKNTQRQVEVKILPINSLAQDNDFDGDSSEVFIQLKQLKPVFRHQSYDYDKMRIKVQGSIINAGKIESQQNSTLKVKQQLKDSTSGAFSYLYYAYMIICFALIIIQMSPGKKV